MADMDASGTTYDLSTMPVEEIAAKVESGDLPSCTYNTFAEYVKGMES